MVQEMSRGTPKFKILISVSKPLMGYASKPLMGCAPPFFSKKNNISYLAVMPL